MKIYEPSDDSFLFRDYLENYFKSLGKKDLRYLDVGTGSGILVEMASKFLDKENVFSCDINSEAVEKVRNLGFNCMESDLFEKIEGKFDLITFNAPYLPEDENEPEDSRIATTGGRMGDETSVRFLTQAKEHLNECGKVFLLISSLTPREKIDEFGGVEVARKKVFMEDLIILEFSF